MPDPFYPFAPNDLIINQRANGWAGMPSYVESGAGATPNAGVDFTLALGVCLVGGFRVTVPSKVFLAAGFPVGTKWYVYAEATATFDGGSDLDGVSPVEYNAYSSTQVFSTPNFGMLVATVVDDGSGNYLTEELFNRGIPLNKGEFTATNVVHVGPVGSDYQKLQVAIKDSASGTKIICHKGGDYAITPGFTGIVAKTLHIVSAATIDPTVAEPLSQDIILIDALAIGPTEVIALSNSDVYLKGIRIDNSFAGPFFEVDAFSNFTMDSCYARSIGAGNIVKNIGGIVNFNNNYFDGNFASSVVYLQDTADGILNARRNLVRVFAGDGFDIQKGTAFTTGNVFEQNAAAKFAFKNTSSLGAFISQSTNDIFTANLGTAFEYNPTATHKMEIRGSSFRASSGANSFIVTTGLIEVDAGTSIFDSDGTVTIAAAASVTRERVTAEDWETPSLLDIMNQGSFGGTKGPTGLFENGGHTDMTFTDGTRTFEISPSASSFDFWVQGIKYTKTAAENVVITDTEGVWFIYYDNTGTLTASQTPFDYSSQAQVALVYWNATDNEGIIFADERHGPQMPWATHEYLHISSGTQHVTGLATTEKTTPIPGDGTLDADAEVEVEDGSILDEDLRIDIADGSGGPFLQDLQPIAQIPVFYRDTVNAFWRKFTADDFPVADAGKVTSGTRLHFNDVDAGGAGVWGFTELTNNNFVAMWIVATDNINEPVIAICGQRQDTSLANAQANNTIDSLDVLDTPPVVEGKIISRIIFKTSNLYTNAVLARIEEILSLEKTDSATITML